MNAELNELNAKIQRNVATRDRADRARQKANRENNIRKAIDACRIPVVLTVATWITVSMGLAELTLGWLATAPCLLYVCFQAGTVR